MVPMVGYLAVTVAASVVVEGGIIILSDEPAGCANPVCALNTEISEETESTCFALTPWGCMLTSTMRTADPDVCATAAGVTREIQIGFPNGIGRPQMEIRGLTGCAISKQGFGARTGTGPTCDAAANIDKVDTIATLEAGVLTLDGKEEVIDVPGYIITLKDISATEKCVFENFEAGPLDLLATDPGEGYGFLTRGVYTPTEDCAKDVPQCQALSGENSVIACRDALAKDCSVTLPLNYYYQLCFITTGTNGEEQIQVVYPRLDALGFHSAEYESLKLTFEPGQCTGVAAQVLSPAFGGSAAEDDFECLKMAEGPTVTAGTFASDSLTVALKNAQGAPDNALYAATLTCLTSSPLLSREPLGFVGVFRGVSSAAAFFTLSAFTTTLLTFL